MPAITATGGFPGFTREDFDVFSVPDFSGRMALIRSRLRPKLLQLATDLTPAVTELTGARSFPHVAQHMRRRVNPPAETWAAFCRDGKGYKRWTHFRVAISADGVRATVFVEDDADDKPLLASALTQDAPGLLSRLPPGVQWYTLEPSTAPTDAALRAAGDRLARVKLQKFQAGLPLGRETALRLSGPELAAWAEQQFARLQPLYAAATP